MESRKLTLKIVVALAAAFWLGAPRAEAIPPGFKPCVQYCPKTPPYTYMNCWTHCYLEWCRSNVPPQYRDGCHSLIFQPGLAAGLVARDSGHPVGYEVTDAGVAYFDFAGRPDVHLSVADLRASTNPAQAITVWYLPGGADGADWAQVGKGSPSASGGWDVLILLDLNGEPSPTGTLALEVVRSKQPLEDSAFALCPVLHAPKVSFDGLSNYALGSATLSVEDDGAGGRRLPVSNIGSSGQDGVAIDLLSSGSRFRPAFFDVFFDVEAPAPDASLQVRVAQGDVNGDGVEEDLAQAAAKGTADGVDLKVRFPWLPGSSDVTRTLQFYLGEQQVGTVEGVIGDDVGTARLTAGSPSPWPKDIHIIFDPFHIELTWTGSLTDARAAGAAGVDIAAGGQVFHCDRLRVSPDGVKPPRSKLTSFVMTASGIGSITVNEEDVRSAPAVSFVDLDHQPLGDAEIAIQDDGAGHRRLPVSNLGSSGQDGVSVDLKSGSLRHRPAFFDIFIEAAVVEWQTSRMGVRVAAEDLDGDGKADLVADGDAHGTDSGIELRSDFPWAAPDAPVALSYYSGTTLVGKSKATNGGLAGLVVSDPEDPAGRSAWPKDVHVEITYDPFSITITFTWTGSGSSTARGAGGSTGASVLIGGELVHIDRLEMTPEGSSLESFTGLESFEMTASGIPEIVITDENYGELVTAPLFRRGDANGDSRVDIGDPIFLLGYLFSGSKTPACMDAADVNDTGKVDLSDPISALNYLFLGAKAPPAPGTSTCGTDPTEDALACEEYSACP